MVDREDRYEAAIEQWRSVIPEDRYEGCRRGARDLGRLSRLLAATAFRLEEPAQLLRIEE